MDVGARHDGFCDPLATDATEACLSVGDSGPAHEFSTFPSHADNFHTRGILPVVHPRDCSATWSDNIHSVGQRPEVYNVVLVEFPKGYGDTVDH